MSKYEAVIGLEVHVELRTEKKIFCHCKNEFGAEPNTNICPVCIALPGALPVLNRQVIDYAIKAGLACNSQIAPYSQLERKNYFYPDLPSAYQITQGKHPLCLGGHIDVETADGKRRIRLNHIHIEADAGKLTHLEGEGTLVDLNRAGVPLIEIVTEPDIRSAAEADAFLRKIRALVQYTGVSDGRMDRGSMRCDVNLSVRLQGSEELGTRTEMKNINSFNFVVKAIEHEFKRQVDILESGGQIDQETRRFDSNTGTSSPLRSKEDAMDYRYFPDPDLVPVTIMASELEKIKAEIPELPDARMALYVERWDLSRYDAGLLTGDIRIADFFEDVAKKTSFPKLAANLIIADLLPDLPEEGEIPLLPWQLADLADLLGKEEINSNTGRKVFKLMLSKTEALDPNIYIEENNLAQINDRFALEDLIKTAVANNERAVTDYKKGKEIAIKAIIGQVMKATSGLANPLITEEMIKEKIAEIPD